MDPPFDHTVVDELLNLAGRASRLLAPTKGEAPHPEQVINFIQV